MEWQTSEPPMDREIECETTGGEIRKGQLVYNGKFGTSSTAAGLHDALKNQFMLKDGKPEMFEVRRWREVS